MGKKVLYFIAAAACNSWLVNLIKMLSSTSFLSTKKLENWYCKTTYPWVWTCGVWVTSSADPRSAGSFGWSFLLTRIDLTVMEVTWECVLSMEVLIGCTFSLNPCQRNIYIALNKQIQTEKLMQILVAKL